MTRIADWEKKFNEAIQFHLDEPFEYGKSDCYMLCDDVVKAITGNRIYSKVSYKTELGSKKQLLKHGFDNVQEAFLEKFKEIPPSTAKRGDLGVVINENGIAGGVFTALGFMTKGPNTGNVFLSHDKVTTAFEVL